MFRPITRASIDSLPLAYRWATAGVTSRATRHAQHQRQAQCSHCGVKQCQWTKHGSWHPSLEFQTGVNCTSCSLQSDQSLHTLLLLEAPVGFVLRPLFAVTFGSSNPTADHVSHVTLPFHPTPSDQAQPCMHATTTTALTCSPS
jgi:hypothetical protein